MKNNELDRLLQSIREPERAPEYWNEFPKKVVAHLHWRVGGPSGADPRPAPGIRRLAGWTLGLATSGVIVALAVVLWREHESRPEASQVLRMGKYYQEIEALFPNQLETIVFDPQGTHLVLAPEADVPASPPLYVRICDGKNCSSFVTFSGQEIQLAGQKMTVLSDAHGGIILTGDRFLWSSAERIDGGSHWQIEARNLSSIPL